KIYELKERIKFLTSKMSAPGSPSGSRPLLGSRERSRSRSRSRSRRRSIVEIISLDTLSNDRLLEEINTSADELHDYALGTKHAGNVTDLANLVERIMRASEIIHNRTDTLERGLAATRETLLHQITELEAKVFQLEESLEGAKAKIEAKDEQIGVLFNDADALGNTIHDLRTELQ